MKDETIEEKFDKLFAAHQQAKFIIGQFEAANQSLTEQNQKLVNEAVKIREALRNIDKCIDSQNSTHEVIWRIVNEALTGLTINEK